MKQLTLGLNEKKILSITSVIKLRLRLSILKQKVKLSHQLPLVMNKILLMNWKHINGMFSETIVETNLKLDQIRPQKMLQLI